MLRVVQRLGIQLLAYICFSRPKISNLGPDKSYRTLCNFALTRVNHVTIFLMTVVVI